MPWARQNIFKTLALILQGVWFGRAAGLKGLLARGAQAHPEVLQKRRLYLSPTDALIDLIVECWLCRQIPVWQCLHTLIERRIALIPQRWTACRCDVWRLAVHADVLQNLPHLGPVGDKRDEAHLAAALTQR